MTPVESKVLVEEPSSTVIRYDFVPSKTVSANRVADPTHIGKTPVAIGSNVPP